MASAQTNAQIVEGAISAFRRGDMAAVLEALDPNVEVEFTGEPWPPLDEVTRAMASAYRHLTGLGLS